MLVAGLCSKMNASRGERETDSGQSHIPVGEHRRRIRTRRIRTSREGSIRVNRGVALIDSPSCRRCTQQRGLTCHTIAVDVLSLLRCYPLYAG